MFSYDSSKYLYDGVVIASSEKPSFLAVVDTPKSNWFKLITPQLLGRVNGLPAGVDPLAADEFAGDGRQKLDPLAPTKTQDLYGRAEEQRNAPRRR